MESFYFSVIIESPITLNINFDYKLQDILSSLLSWSGVVSGREGTLGWKLYWYPKFCDTFLFFDSKALGTFGWSQTVQPIFISTEGVILSIFIEYEYHLYLIVLSLNIPACWWMFKSKYLCCRKVKLKFLCWDHSHRA